MQSNLLDEVFEKSFIVRLMTSRYMVLDPNPKEGTEVTTFIENKEERQQTKDMYASQANNFLQMIKYVLRRNLTLYYDKTVS